MREKFNLRKLSYIFMLLIHKCFLNYLPFIFTLYNLLYIHRFFFLSKIWRTKKMYKLLSDSKKCTCIGYRH